MASSNEEPGIGRLNERSLHASLKEWYAEPGDRLEVRLGGFVIDIVRGDQLIEIQTRNFGAVKHKLRALLARYRVILVHPIAQEKWLLKLPSSKVANETRRKSPKRGRVEELFSELVSCPDLMEHADFSLEVLLTHEVEVRKHVEGRAWRRRGWVTQERRLIDVVERRVFYEPADLADLLPDTLNDEFTTADIADAMAMPLRMAQRTAFCLRETGAIELVGKQGNSLIYVRANCSNDVSSIA